MAIIHNFGASIFFEEGRMEAIMIDELIFSTATSKIFKRNEKFFIRYDSGELVSKLVNGKPSVLPEK